MIATTHEPRDITYAQLLDLAKRRGIVGLLEEAINIDRAAADQFTSELLTPSTSVFMEAAIEAGFDDLTEVARALANTPVVGKGCTYNVGSDCYAGTIVWVSGSRRDFCWVDYPDGQPPGYTARLCKDGRYHIPGGVRAPSVSVGVRRTYRDPSF